MITMRARLHREERGLCHYCKRTLTVDAVTIDHIVPRAFGGINDWSNYVGCCRACNEAWGPATRKCGCTKCHRALASHLQAANRNGGPPPEQIPPGGVVRYRPTSWFEATAAIEATLAAVEERLQHYKRGSAGDSENADQMYGTPEVAALAGKCKGLRIALGLIRDVVKA